MALIERAFFPHAILFLPGTLRAIECPDREALHVFYKSTFSL